MEAGARRAALAVLTLGELLLVRIDLERRPLDGAITRPVRHKTWTGMRFTRDDAEAVTDLILRQVRATRVPCLPRALVRYRLLVRMGETPVFKMGVRTTPSGDVVGHAWVEIDGVPFAERESTDYTVTLSHGGAA